MYINNMVFDIVVFGNFKFFWNYIKSKCNGMNILVFLKVGDKELIDDESIVSSFNFYFLFVFIFEDFINLFFLEFLVCEKFNYIFCIIEEILKYFKFFKMNKFLGLDRILLVILKLCVFELVFLILFLVNKFFLLGYLFEDWRLVDIVLFYKKGFKYLRENYCLILFIFMICKISEKIVCDRLMLFW